MFISVKIKDMIHLNLQRIMDDKNLTPHDIAPQMNISERSIYRTIRAERCPDLVDLIYFSRVLGVPVEELFTVDEEDGTEIRKE